MRIHLQVGEKTVEKIRENNHEGKKRTYPSETHVVRFGRAVVGLEPLPSSTRDRHRCVDPFFGPLQMLKVTELIRRI